MTTYTTDSPGSLEEQRIMAALVKIAEWKAECACRHAHFCESYGCSTLDELAAILKGDFHEKEKAR